MMLKKNPTKPNKHTPKHSPFQVKGHGKTQSLKYSHVQFLSKKRNFNPVISGADYTIIKG